MKRLHVYIPKSPATRVRQMIYDELKTKLTEMGYEWPKLAALSGDSVFNIFIGDEHAKANNDLFWGALDDTRYSNYKKYDAVELLDEFLGDAERALRESQVKSIVVTFPVAVQMTVPQTMTFEEIRQKLSSIQIIHSMDDPILSTIQRVNLHIGIDDLKVVNKQL